MAVPRGPLSTLYLRAEYTTECHAYSTYICENFASGVEPKSLFPVAIPLSAPVGLFPYLKPVCLSCHAHICVEIDRFKALTTIPSCITTYTCRKWRQYVDDISHLNLQEFWYVEDQCGRDGWDDELWCPGQRGGGNQGVAVVQRVAHGQKPFQKKEKLHQYGTVHV